MTRGEILIRAQEPEDGEAIAAIFTCPSVVAETLQLPFRSRAERRESVAQKQEGDHRLVAEVDGIVVGTLGLHVDATPRRRHCGRIGIAVHDRFQGQGVGAALLAAAINLADNWLGLHRLELQVYSDNAAAIRLYEKVGFVVEGIARDFALRDGVFVDALLMARLRTAPGEDPGGEGWADEFADTP
jgi:L-phenylalanine/L-methionine N-acetyltransferase